MKKGRTILVLGGTGALGWPIALACASLPATIVTASRRKKGASESDHVRHIQCDITRAASIKRCASTLKQDFPPLWAVINCAGYNAIRRCDGYSAAELRRILDVNLYGAMLVASHLVPLLKANRGGKLITVSSQAGLDPQVGNTAYSAAKSGVIAFGSGLARELAPFGIAVLTVCPGDIESPMMERALKEFAAMEGQSPESVRRQLYQTIPMGRFGTTAEVAEVIVELLRIESLFLTGSTITVAGGRTCH